jgi:hypothetical protein
MNRRVVLRFELSVLEVMNDFVNTVDDEIRKRTLRDLVYIQMFLDLILNEAVSTQLCFEIRYMYVYSMAGRTKFGCLSAMRITPLKAEQGYTILDDCHRVLSETSPLPIETTILGVLCKFKLYVMNVVLNLSSRMGGNGITCMAQTRGLAASGFKGSSEKP